MALWTFRDYLDLSGQSVIEDWLAALGPKRPKVEARLDARIAHVQNLEQSQWPRDYFTELAGYSGIFEMKFTVQNIQYRPLGCFGPDRYEFSFLIGAIEKNSKFIPANAPDTALRRKAEIVRDKNSRTCEHE